jgi:hypothetical protein
MKGLFALLLLVGGLTVVSTGCNSRPDPRENPEFNEETYSDPSNVLGTMGDGTKVPAK